MLLCPALHARGPSSSSSMHAARSTCATSQHPQRPGQLVPHAVFRAWQSRAWLCMGSKAGRTGVMAVQLGVASCASCTACSPAAQPAEDLGGGFALQCLVVSLFLVRVVSSAWALWLACMHWQSHAGASGSALRLVMQLCNQSVALVARASVHAQAG
jgi:hypothetical protein